MSEKSVSNFVQFPKCKIDCPNAQVFEGFAAISEILKEKVQGEKTVLTIECYPGVDQNELLEGIASLEPTLVIHSDELAFEPEKWMRFWKKTFCLAILFLAS